MRCGLDALQTNRLQQAEEIFKTRSVALAQPEHFDEYYGLAQVYQRHAPRLLPQVILFADGSLDPSNALELKQFRLQLDPGSSPAV